MKKVLTSGLLSLFAVTAVTGLGAGQAAAQGGPQCPKTLPVTETVRDVPAGFKAYQDGNPPKAPDGSPLPLPLAAILFWNGEPNGQPPLPPSSQSRAALTWRFTPAQTQNLWLACAYDATAIMIASKMPASVSSCTVTLSPDGNMAAGLTCQ
ncbi:STY0301 family protein [Nitrospirillum sp. BR 11163]|uniref:STY0301 family protein n=1 Tax=Nitrospirillum sp. BR 11163 TaxID=3104323 RepID=UPI002AFE45CC|nr:STY0301 family protein [Nitrospirillum sp. BR 11163]MEA1676074.1 STY0301 family protein [Nitrospirillum sp. BR 11163]